MINTTTYNQTCNTEQMELLPPMEYLPCNDWEVLFPTEMEEVQLLKNQTPQLPQELSVETKSESKRSWTVEEKSETVSQSSKSKSLSEEESI